MVENYHCRGGWEVKITEKETIETESHPETWNMTRVWLRSIQAHETIKTMENTIFDCNAMKTTPAFVLSGFLCTMFHLQIYHISLQFI